MTPVQVAPVMRHLPMTARLTGNLTNADAA